MQRLFLLIIVLFFIFTWKISGFFILWILLVLHNNLTLTCLLSALAVLNCRLVLLETCLMITHKFATLCRTYCCCRSLFFLLTRRIVCYSFNNDWRDIVVFVRILVIVVVVYALGVFSVFQTFLHVLDLLVFILENQLMLVFCRLYEVSNNWLILANGLFQVLIHLQFIINWFIIIF